MTTQIPDEMPENAESQSPKMQLLKLALEMGPLVIFFIVNSRAGIFNATAAFMVAIVIALGLSWWFFKKLAVMPLVTCIFVMVFGGLTLYLQNETFIKLKPTIVNLMFAAILLGGLMFNRQFLKILFGEVFNLTPEGWHKLTIRWGGFFVVLALINEIVWRNFSTDFWVNFKVFGIMPLTMVFGMMQMPLLMRYQKEDAEQDAKQDGESAKDSSG